MKETTLSKITASVRVAKGMAERALAASPNPQWTEYELQTIDEWIARQGVKLDRAGAIRRLVDLGLKVKDKMTKRSTATLVWTREEDINCAPRRFRREYRRISKRLCRSEKAIWHRALKIGIELTPQRKKSGLLRRRRAWAEGESEMMQNNPPDTGLKIGDKVRLVSGTPLRKDEMGLQGLIGEVVECPELKLVTVRFRGGRLLMGKDAELFERV